MNFDKYKESVPGLPTILKPNFWSELVEDTYWNTPRFDDRGQIVWSPASKAHQYYDKVAYLTHGQIMTGFKNEIARELSTLPDKQSKREYLDKLISYLKLDRTRIYLSEDAENLNDFGRISGASEEDIELANAHENLVSELQKMLNTAYFASPDLAKPKKPSTVTNHREYATYYCLRITDDKFTHNKAAGATRRRYKISDKTISRALKNNPDILDSYKVEKDF
ncbi:hypothetical protein [Dyadobacter sp. LHD-138]|uniref:hypothetical protein n=1 Tax=Dyadobacter sp. LHD-138 TaxID=3071413 RepID=UPI0027E11574|nr:hypothetical protein [Dyadobacter sp. LHD-138]MDQ6482345.1 hypothetical protein [Dyadobacter sp. LHD-138]